MSQWCKWLRSRGVLVVAFTLQMALIYLFLAVKGRSVQLLPGEEDLYDALIGVKRSSDSQAASEAANSQRVNDVREHCANNGYNFTSSLPSYHDQLSSLMGWVWQASPKHHLFYCAAPNCGSTKWKAHLMEDMQVKWKVDVHRAASSILGVQNLFAKDSLPDIPTFLKSYRPANRLIIVRNPWARLVSAYEDKLVERKWHLQRLCIRGDKYEEDDQPVTFETFIDCLVASPRDVLWNSHVTPLTSLCSICLMDYNLIVKLEEMEQVEPYLFNKFGITKTKYVSSRKLEHRTYSSYYEKISKENIRQLQDIYKHDIELFGYPQTPCNH